MIDLVEGVAVLMCPRHKGGDPVVACQKAQADCRLKNTVAQLLADDYPDVSAAWGFSPDGVLSVTLQDVDDATRASVAQALGKVDSNIQVS